jgi:ribosomal protein L37AE/L43A
VIPRNVSVALTEMDPLSKRQELIENEEVEMATVASLRGLAHGMTCNKCGDSMIAPVSAEYFIEERLVLNLWSCMSCGNRFESEAFVPVGAKSKNGSKALEEFVSSLLAA